ncbi:hypothetical protein, partial [Bacillus subtilis]|uniref:hypothetical protein n=1 Tax=Bacillus subtilis TaxID=1423 RepID=UPI0016433213
VLVMKMGRGEKKEAVLFAVQIAFVTRRKVMDEGRVRIVGKNWKSGNMGIEDVGKDKMNEWVGGGKRDGREGGVWC